MSKYRKFVIDKKKRPCYKRITTKQKSVQNRPQKMSIKLSPYRHDEQREKNRRTKIRANWGECALIIPPRTLLKNNFTEYSVLRTYSKRHQQKVVNEKVPKVSAKVSLTNIKFPIFLQCNDTGCRRVILFFSLNQPLLSFFAQSIFLC